MQAKGIRPHMLFESDILSSVIRNVTDGLGVGFAPIPYIKSEIKEGLLKVYPSREALWSHRMIVMSAPSFKAHPFVERLVQIVKREELPPRRPALKKAGDSFVGHHHGT